MECKVSFYFGQFYCSGKRGTHGQSLQKKLNKKQSWTSNNTLLRIKGKISGNFYKLSCGIYVNIVYVKYFIHDSTKN